MCASSARAYVRLHAHVGVGTRMTCVYVCCVCMWRVCMADDVAHHLTQNTSSNSARRGRRAWQTQQLWRPSEISWRTCCHCCRPSTGRSTCRQVDGDGTGLGGTSFDRRRHDRLPRLTASRQTASRRAATTDGASTGCVSTGCHDRQ